MTNLNVADNVLEDLSCKEKKIGYWYADMLIFALVSNPNKFWQTPTIFQMYLLTQSLEQMSPLYLSRQTDQPPKVY